MDFLIDRDDKIVEILKGKLDDITCIFVDEVQFLSKKQIDELFLIAHMTNIDVICYGLGRRINGSYVTEGDEVLIDGEANVEYIPLCGECYLKDVTNVDKEKVKKMIR